MHAALRAALLLSAASAGAALGAGDAGPALVSGALFRTPMREGDAFQGERFAWTVQDEQARFPAPGFTIGAIRPGETLVSLDGDGKPTALRVSIYNRGDAGSALSEEAFLELARRSNEALKDLFGAPGARFERKTDPTKADHDVEGLRWTSAAATAALEYAVRRQGVRFVPAPEYLRLDVRPAGAPDSAAAEAAGGRRVDPRSHVRRGDGGVVELDGVPMVDQGQKGYCAAATVARVMGYYGLGFLDQHQIASWALSDPNNGTSGEAMLRGLSRPLHDRYGLNYREFDAIDDFKSFKKFLDRYNATAKQMGRPEWPLPRGGGVVDVGDYWRAFELPVLRNMRAGNASHLEFWKDRIRKSIDAGVPLIWSVQLGKVPETPAIPQASGGHMRLIVGYTPDSVVYTDSWGAGHERKLMKWEDAIAISTGLRTISWTLN